jgi:glycosyltransferase involved in cell wall biosynthesis
MKNPKISIITVVKNSKETIEKNIQSLMNQNYKNYEHIVIDGGSTDGTVEIINKYRKNINHFISEKDNGIYDAMNKGIDKANGDIIGILNSDDFFYNNALSIVKKYFEEFEKIDFLFGSVDKYTLQHGYYPNRIYWTFGFYTSHSVGFFIKSNVQKRVGYYNTKYKYSSDYDLFYRMIVNLKLKGMATKKNEILGNFGLNGLSSRLKYIDYLNENTQIRLDNGQNKFVVWGIHYLRFFKRILKIIKER